MCKKKQNNVRANVLWSISSPHHLLNTVNPNENAALCFCLYQWNSFYCFSYKTSLCSFDIIFRNMISFPSFMSVLISHLGRMEVLYSDLIHSVTLGITRITDGRLTAVLPGPPSPAWLHIVVFVLYTVGVTVLSKKRKLALAATWTFRGWEQNRFSADILVLSGTFVWPRHAFLYSDCCHRGPVVRRDRRLHLHHPGGHGAVQRQDAAGQSSVQWLWEGGGKWCCCRAVRRSWWMMSINTCK